MGGATTTSSSNQQDKESAECKKRDALKAGLGFMEGFERADGVGDETNKDNGEAVEQEVEDTNKESKESKQSEEIVDPETRRRNMKKAREEKLGKARMRYFQRNGIPIESA